MNSAYETESGKRKLPGAEVDGVSVFAERGVAVTSATDPIWHDGMRNDRTFLTRLLRTNISQRTRVDCEPICVQTFYNLEQLNLSVN
jgi:hypothetical protein